MKDAKLIFSAPDRIEALDYLTRCFGESPLVRQLGSVFPKGGVVTLVTSSTLPTKFDFFTGWGSGSCSEWLEDAALVHLKTSQESVVLFEDIVSSPNDLFITQKPHPPYSFYEGRVFWPVTSHNASRESIEKARAWSAAIQVLAIFTVIPIDVALTIEVGQSSAQAFQIAGSSITKLVVSVFDGEGFMVWDRKSE